MAVTNKDLALAIIRFLETSVADKTVSEEFSESIDVAIDCIADAFEVEKADANTVATKFGGKDLLAAVNSGASSPDTTEKTEIDAETKARADALKAEGNKAMAAKDFAAAVAKYTDAIALDPTNVVYLSNRAAAHSSALQHDKAVQDAEAAIALDNSFSKAYSRLGLAQYALGNAKEAMEAYKKGMEVEGAQPSEAMKRGYETAKKRVEEELENSISTTEPATEQPAEGAARGTGAGAGGLPDLASMFGGGMPNISEMMNNPQVMQAAQSLMSNPGAMEGLMNNPMLRQMAQGMGGESGLEGLMNNPALQNIAKLFMGNQGNQGNSEGGN
ncbi:small glutamine-rich tetratricopeptide repeat-containing protein alpha [Metschnikowia aff. pulcherrima]|uniref:Small glutamine-rich tetratricopeptide repeat-containing protein alpha n=1 Tax=Metschnikowia aff. pulcherrima TaxID=2163413 RepID=A0A4P6XW22_9ASCO|nr:small glutamine-rich tetratricopeptide repeat-containing protein alpha [Metschnikowia aff. pulcherrima]